MRGIVKLHADFDSLTTFTFFLVSMFLSCIPWILYKGLGYRLDVYVSRFPVIIFLNSSPLLPFPCEKTNLSV